MRLIRIYQASELRSGQTVVLDSQSASHVAKVLRLTVGDSLVLFNGEGGEYHGRIDTLSKRSTTVLLDQFVDREVESALKIVLGQCISRGDRMDFAIQKSVDLGVSAIYPLNSQRSGVHIPAERMEKRRIHWQRVAISASEQCGRNQVPAIHPVSNIESWVKMSLGENNFLLDPDADTGITQLKLPGSEQIGLIIGPEGGLSAEEIALAKQSGFTALRLGPRVLRTETAAVATITALQTLWGDLA
jgi:16S rRNA (uracil1498-N3)-methyltransferase